MTRKCKVFPTLVIFFFAAALIFAGGPQRKVLIDKSMAPKPYADGEVLVKFKKGIDLAAVNSFAVAQSLKLKKRFKFFSELKGQEIVLLKSTQGVDAKVLAKTLSGNPNVEYANPNYRRELCVTPNDPRFSELWGMHNTSQTGGTTDADIDAPEAWDISTGSSNVIVAVIDTGLDYNHADLAANCWKNPGEIADNGIDDDGNGYIDDVYGIDPAGVDGSGTSGDSDPMDGYGHGSHCAGSIGARGNNALGVVGVNWNVKIMGLKFFDDEGGNGYDAFSIECIQYAVYQKVHGQNVVAINASWGGYDSSPSEPIDALREAIEVATNAGIVFCAAAGNGDGDADAEGDDNDSEIHHYPSDYTLPGIVSVAATDHNDDLGSFSNYGATSVDLGAPGVSILSTVPRAYLPHEGDVFFDDMEHGTGNWVTSGTNNSWAITDEYEIYWGGDYPSCPSPTHFWSDRPGVGGSYTFYLSNTNSFLTYNADIDLSSYAGQDVYLGLTMGRHIGRNDHVYVQISGNSGGSWYTIQDWGYTSGSVYFWASFSWAIPEAYKTAHFRMRFNLVSNASDNGIGVVFDNIGIVTSLTSPYESWNGTSMATPHVSGAVAYLASIFPTETVAQRKERILYGGDLKPALSGTTVTGRRLNLYGAYAYTPASGPSITVTSPNGGEVWTRGTTHAVTWTTNGTVGNVQIHYSLDSGVSWTQIVASTPSSTGTYSWTISGGTTPSANCLIRIREASDGDPSDTSDSVFAIIDDSITETISTPNAPSGPSTGMEGVSYTFTASGAASSAGHSIQYRFDWDDGTLSSWLPEGTTSASHIWMAASTHNVRAQARCATHFVESEWSDPHPISLDDTPTWAAISRFAVSEAESQPTVEWRTASEIGAIGFNLWRRDRMSKQFDLVNTVLLPALANAPRGGVYRLADPGAQYGEPVTYRLEEVDARGRTMSYGPFTVTFGATEWQRETEDFLERAGSEEPVDIYGYRRFQLERSLYEKERLRALKQERLIGGIELGAGKVKERARITVQGRGLFYVSAAQVAGSLGIPEAQAAAFISQYKLKLSGMGKNIAWLADANGAGVFFYNPGETTVFCERNVYWLERGSGLAMETVGSGNAGAADPGQTFQDTVHFEGNRYALLGPYMDPLGDVWLWDYVEGGGGAKSFAIDVPGVAASGTATLTVALQGATDTAADADHHAMVALNGHEIGDSSWDGTAAHTFQVTFSQSLLNEGANTIVVSGLLDTGAPYSVFYVESFDLSYRREYRAESNALICRGDNNAVITVTGMSEPQVLVLDVGRADRPKQVTGATPDVSGRVTFVPRSADGMYLVSGLNAARRPLSVVGDRPAQIKGQGNAAEYLVIAPEELQGAAQELADYRQKHGLKTAVVTLEDIYESFNYGMPSPLAVRDFLAYAYANWKNKRPKYAVLVGKGTYDYNDYMGYGDNLLPVILAGTPEGLCAADKAFGDVTGRNGVPEIAVGRLPAVTRAELRAMIAKIEAYEGGQGAWTDQGIFIADNGDNGGDFAATSNELAGAASGFHADKIYLSGSPSETRARIIASWNAGAGLVNYVGHAGIDQLATENIFNVAAAMSLANGSRLPLAVMLTCVAGRFELPGFTSLGEALLLNGDGGSGGGLFPSGAAMNADSLRLGLEFYKAALLGKGTTAGQALITAMKKYIQNAGAPYLLNVYNWLGDPALKFK